jgi:hypothetical protein
MNDNEAILSRVHRAVSLWNKGKLIGAKPPLRASHVRSIRTKLQLEKRTRDFALFNLAIEANCAAAMSWRCASMMWPRRLHARSSKGPPEEDWSPGPVRAHQANAASDRRVS